jgi:hypothetical protein
VKLLLEQKHVGSSQADNLSAQNLVTVAIEMHSVSAEITVFTRMFCVNFMKHCFFFLQFIPVENGHKTWVTQSW